MNPIIKGNVRLIEPYTIYNDCELIALHQSNIQLLGNNSLYPHSRLLAEGEKNQIILGKNTRIQIRSQLHGDVSIGSDSIIAPDVYISSGTHLYDFMPMLTINEQDVIYKLLYCDFSKPVAIGDDVWIGRLSTVMPGVTIGNHAVIGANSVVTKDVPPSEVWGGNPCRFIKKRGALENHSRRHLPSEITEDANSEPKL